MCVQMEFDGARPIFVQLAEKLEAAILSGSCGEGEQIPSITEYAVAYQINPATALKGVNLLVDEGLLFKKRGVGMFVAEGAREKLLRRRQDGFYETRILPAVREAKQLGLTQTEVEAMVERGFQDVD